jgi:tRNA-specific 2-thiouridylase
MQLWNQRRLAGHEGMPEQVQGRCCSIDDVYDARRVAEELGIPYYVVNHEERFERDVVRPFIDEFDAGRNRWLLRRAADPAKDQTYFLFGLTQEQLSRTLFPLGHMNKPQVRELAREHHLALAEKPDSQEICFVPGGDYKRFIDAYLSEQGEQLPDTSGELVTTDGKVLGQHEGIHNFTVGQRKGLGVATGSPLYVININGAEGKVTVGGNDDLLSRTLIARDVNWIAVESMSDPIRVSAKIRHRHEPAPAMLENAPNGEVRVTFDEPQRAITPGQAVVFYQDDLVVGGGWIAETVR